MVSGKNPCVYILASARNGILYIGVTSNLFERIQHHRNETYPGFTRKYRVKQLVYYEMHQDIVGAIAREKHLKQWNRAWKIRLIEGMNPEWLDLYDPVAHAVHMGPADAARDVRS